MPFQILLKRRDESVREDLPLYFGAAPSPGEVMTLEIDGRVVQVRVTEIRVGKPQKASASPLCTVHAREM